MGGHIVTSASETFSISICSAGPSAANTSVLDEQDHRGRSLRISGVAEIYRATLSMSAAGESIAEVASVRSGGPAVDVKRKRISEDDRGTGKRRRIAERSTPPTPCTFGGRPDARYAGDMTSSLPKHLKRKRGSTHDNGLDSKWQRTAEYIDTASVASTSDPDAGETANLDTSAEINHQHEVTVLGHYGQISVPIPGLSAWPSLASGSNNTLGSANDIAAGSASPGKTSIPTAGLVIAVEAVLERLESQIKQSKNVTPFVRPGLTPYKDYHRRPPLIQIFVCPADDRPVGIQDKIPHVSHFNSCRPFDAMPIRIVPLPKGAAFMLADYEDATDCRDGLLIGISVYWYGG
ncbi:hypothetical protein F5146DRAFT_110624 [Armillaria mellea]|nr:hypothetical protein F5146DRAFT_110624 [Armillaria mellea]